jgi:hypothetical protein
MQSNDLNASTALTMAIGVDVGGSSIKCALVDLATGEFVGERLSTPTPAWPSCNMEPPRTCPARCCG